MNDRLKFRVWDSENDRYIPHYQCFISGNGKFYYKDEQNQQMYNWTSDFIVEQCTGLKDKNGKLIFEGDIVEYINLNKTKYKYEIFFNDQISALTLKLQNIYNFGPSCFMNRSDQLEVIGNIHDEVTNEQY